MYFKISLEAIFPSFSELILLSPRMVPDEMIAPESEFAQRQTPTPGLRDLTIKYLISVSTRRLCRIS